MTSSLLSALAKLPSGGITGIGSLPCESPKDAAALSLELCPDLPFIPQLVRRNAAEGMIAQVLLGLPGFSMTGDRLVLDHSEFSSSATAQVDMSGEAWVGLRSFLVAARSHLGPVKWQIAGPITVGMALIHHGVATTDAFDVALRAVRSTALAVHRQVAKDLPTCQQVVFFDEPSAGAVQRPNFPISPDEAIDLVSGALAALEGQAIVGLHCCAEADVPALLAAGPGIVALPISPAIGRLGGYLGPFLDNGGVVAWGVVPTDGPLANSSDRYWHELSALWCELVGAGCDPVRLRRQALLTPACGMTRHTADQARRIFELTQGVATRVAEQAAATRLIIGA